MKVALHNGPSLATTSHHHFVEGGLACSMTSVWIDTNDVDTIVGHCVEEAMYLLKITMICTQKNLL